VQGESLGPAIRHPPGYEKFLDYSPTSSFVVLRYAYAFGGCLVNSLYAVYEKIRIGGLPRPISDARGPAEPSTISDC